MTSARYIAVIGAGDCDEETRALAAEVGRLIARAGAVLVCGGLGGVMEAACRGARSEGGVTIGILPGLDRSEGNAWLEYSICTGTGHARNLAVVTSGDIVIAINGEFGTLSELGHARKCGRIVITLDSWQISRDGEAAEGIIPASSPAEAVKLAMETRPAGRS